MRTFEIEEGSEIDGVALAKADLRRTFGVTVLAVKRGEEIEPNPDPATPLRHGEAIVAFGTPDQLAALARAARVSAS
jgi:Putative regulatory, ligand-binding protein related to C-terminal domains of K+ channels